MPSEKPRFTVRTEQETLDKIGYIAQQNERTTTQEIVYLIKQRVREYEREHGEIRLSGASINVDFLKENSDRMKFRSKAGGKKE